MSENVLTVIPDLEDFIPSEQARYLAKGKLERWIPGARKISIVESEHVRFYDSGVFFETITCPNCGVKIEVTWWQDAMNKAYESKFAFLEIVTPCCGFHSSLNRLSYDWPCGFARFAIVIHSPGAGISEPQSRELSHLLETEIRTIRTRY